MTVSRCRSGVQCLRGQRSSRRPTTSIRPARSKCHMRPTVSGTSNRFETWIKTMPCNFNQRRLAEHVKAGIRAAGGQDALAGRPAAQVCR